MTEGARLDWSGRLHSLQSSLAANGLDALVVSAPLNLAYLTGFTGSAGLLLLTPSQRFLIIDGRYELAVLDQLASGTLADLVPERVDRRYDLTLGAVVVRERIGRIGFEAAHVAVATLGRWERASPGVAWQPTERMVERQRAVKDTGEIQIFRRAGRALAGVAGALGSLVTRNQTERAVAAAIDAALERAGFERPAFTTIVASGPHSARPHARPTDRRLVPGDLVLLDFGGVLGGYCVDLTRMATVGPAAPEAMLLYEAVVAAHAAAIGAVRPGAAASAIDQAARQVLEDRGLGPAFLHATGHGLGLEVHEAPRLARAESDGSDVIEAGMVFTIEPGAYVEQVGGVRLEDDVLVTADGCEVLTDAPRALLVV